jgi:hypothetical protein
MTGITSSNFADGPCSKIGSWIRLVEDPGRPDGRAIDILGTHSENEGRNNMATSTPVQVQRRKAADFIRIPERTQATAAAITAARTELSARTPRRAFIYVM